MKVLWGITLAASFIFIIQTVMTFLGADAGGDFDMDAGGRAAFETAVAALRVTWRTPVAANATITVGEELSREQVVLAAPKAVHPSAALMPEYGFFRNDKRFLGAGEKESWPKAEARFAWTPSALKAVVTVSDKEYVVGVDTAGIEILDPMFFRTYGGEAKKLKVLSAKPVRTTGSGSTATHEFEIPWTDVPGGNPGRGGRVAFNLLCPCAPHARDRKVRYSLVLCEPTEKAAQRRFHCAFLQFEEKGK